MENKLTKVIIGGKEYIVTDKQAQQMLDIISGLVEDMREEIRGLQEMLTWKEIK